MEIGFNQLDKMTVGEVIKLHKDRERIEREGGFTLRICSADAKEINKEEFNLDKFLEEC